MEIKFINHACVILKSSGCGLLMDPWVIGSAFNGSWELMCPTDLESFLEDLETVDYIFVSHEHPDHFSIPSLRFIKKHSKKAPTVLFQLREDRRVADFCKSLGFDVKVLEPSKPVAIGDLELILGKNGFIDSWCFIRSGNVVVLNLNDCELSGRDLRSINRRVSENDHITVLGQFSFAAWKPNALAATESIKSKINALSAAARTVGAARVIPIASFASYVGKYSHELEDWRLEFSETHRLLKQSCDSQIVWLVPGQSISEIKCLGSPLDNLESLEFWSRCFKTRPRFVHKTSEMVPSLQSGQIVSGYHVFQERISEASNRWLLYMIEGFSFQFLLGSVRVYLSDLGEGVEIGYRNFKFLGRNKEFDIEMESTTLNLVLTQGFGVDTLSVGSEFKEIAAGGFTKFVRSMFVAGIDQVGVELKFRNAFRLVSHSTRLIQLLVRVWRMRLE